jgi:hypothetical protein
LGWDGTPWVHPDDRFAGMLHPVTGIPYSHRGQFTLENAQIFMEMVTSGMDFNRSIEILVEDPTNPYFGQPRWGLAPEP